MRSIATTTPNATEAEIDEARVIAAACRAGVERQAIQRALRISRRTFFRRKALARQLRAARRAEAEFTIEEAGCR